MSEPAKTRTVSLFRNGRNQAVRIPRGWELPGDEARLVLDGGRLVLEPIEPVPERSTRSLLAWLKTLEPLPPEDRFPDDVDDDLLPTEPVTAFEGWKDD